MTAPEDPNETFGTNRGDVHSEPREGDTPVLNLDALRISAADPITETRPNPKASKDRPRLGAWGGRNRGGPAAPSPGAADAPRRGRAAGSQPKTRKQTPAYKSGMFVEPLTNVYVGLGAMLTPFDAVCGNAIIQSAPECAKSLDELARQNEAVRRALVAMSQTSAVGAVLVAHLPIIMAAAAHHSPVMRERVPAGIPGFTFDANVGAKAAENGSAAA